MKNMKFLLARRVTQISLMLLYFLGNAYGFSVLKGTFGASLLFGTIPLSDPYTIMQVLFSGFVLGADVLIGGAIIIIFYGVFAGRGFCSWVCPVNLITDLVNYIRRRLALDGKEVKYKFLKRNTRYWIMLMSFAVSFVLGVAAFEIFSPISIMQRGLIFGFGMGIFLLIGVFLLDLFGIKNGWCGHLCPLGAFYAIAGSKSLINIKHTAENCTKCMECKVVCPEVQVLSIISKQSGYISGMECTNCARCIDVCNDNALHFGIRDFIKKGKK